jgi:hypothetical protein
MSEMLKTKKEIIAWCHQYKVCNYTINEDLSLDVNDKVNLLETGLEFLPVQFNQVKGNFAISYNNLTTLKGCPKKVLGHFICQSNQLVSLVGGPEEVTGAYIAIDNQLKNLEGICNQVSSLYLNQNPLLKLDILPHYIKNCLALDVCDEKELVKIAQVKTLETVSITIALDKEVPNYLKEYGRFLEAYSVYHIDFDKFQIYLEKYNLIESMIKESNGLQKKVKL